MARTVGFHGRVIIHPGAEAYVDLSGMVQPGIALEDISSVVGEAPYGEPGVVHVFADADSARQYFGAGSDLADGIQILFSPSNDDRVVGGASLVYAYKANRSTQAERWLVTDPIAGELVFQTTGAAVKTSSTNAYVTLADPLGVHFGKVDLFKNLIIEVTAGWGSGRGGQQRQIKSSEKVDPSVAASDIKIELRDDLDWDIPPYQIPFTTVVRIAIPQQKLYAAEWGTLGIENRIEHGPSTEKEGYKLNSTYAGRVENPANTYGGLTKPPMYLRFDPTGGGISWNNPSVWVAPPAKSGGLDVYGTTSGGTATATLLNGGVNVTDDTHNNRWVLVTNVIPGQEAYLGKCYKIKRSDLATLSLELYEPGLGAAPGNWLTWQVIALTDCYIKVEGRDGVATTIKAYMQDTPGPAASPTDYNEPLFSLSLAAFPTLGALVQRINEIPGMLATLGEGVNPDLPSSRLDFSDASEHYGREQIGVVDLIALPGTNTLTLDANWRSASYFPSGSVLPYPLKIQSPDHSVEEIVWVTNNTGVTLTILGQGASNGLVNTISPGYEVYRLANDESDYKFGSQLIYGPGEVASGSSAIYGEALRDNCQALVDYVTTGTARFFAERAMGPSSDDYAPYVGATEPENDENVYKQLYHGEPGFSVVQKPADTDPNYPISWEHGFEELMKEKDIRNIVPLVSEDKPNWTAGDIDTLINMFQGNLLDAEEARAERQGYLGLRLPLESRTIAGVSYARGLVEWAQYLNESRMSLLGQEMKLFRSNGVEDWVAPWGFACAAAGIQLGTDLGEGLTLKYVKASALRQSFNDWDPRDRADLRKALLGGLFIGEPYKGRWRIVRGLTTHVSSDNLARTDINVWEIRNFVMRDLREKLEERFGGVGIGAPGEGVRYAAPGNIASIREYIASILEEYRADGVIIDSQDEQKRTIHAWTGLAVKISGDIARVKVQVFPKTALNFILIDFAFQLPNLSA